MSSSSFAIDLTGDDDYESEPHYVSHPLKNGVQYDHEIASPTSTTASYPPSSVDSLSTRGTPLTQVSVNNGYNNHIAIPVQSGYHNNGTSAMTHAGLPASSSAFFPDRQHPHHLHNDKSIQMLHNPHFHHQHSPQAAIFHDREQTPPMGSLMNPHPQSSMPNAHPSPNGHWPIAPRQPSQTPQNAIIDLTRSPSPPPIHHPRYHQHEQQFQQHQQYAPPRFSQAQQNEFVQDPKRPACIGQLQSTALVLYPIPYLESPISDWVPVRLSVPPRHPQNTGDLSVCISTPSNRAPGGEMVEGEQFGVVENKASKILAVMMTKGLVKCDAKVLRGKRNPILPLQMLLFTPQGNVPVLGPHLFAANLILNHPSVPFDMNRILACGIRYINPHSEHLAQQQQSMAPRFGTPPAASKSVEIQRSQAETMFKNLRSGEELEETEPPKEYVETVLYPHQKKALTFLLEREGERPGASKLWNARKNLDGQVRSWVHLVTNKELSAEDFDARGPQECKGSLLADDMGLGKTIACVSLIASTLQSARDYCKIPLPIPVPPPTNLTPEMENIQLQPSHFNGAVWGMPPTNNTPNPAHMTKKQLAKLKAETKSTSAAYVRQKRICVRSRATLVICPLSTVSNWEDQFREHWRGDVYIVGGSGGGGVNGALGGGGGAVKKEKDKDQQSQMTLSSWRSPEKEKLKKEEEQSQTLAPTPPGSNDWALPTGVSFTSTSNAIPKTPSPPPKSSSPKAAYSSSSPQARLKIYIYHGNARRPDPSFLADFDVVITTYATLASEYSKQLRSITANEEKGASEEDEGEGSGGGGADDIFDDEGGMTNGTSGVIRLVGGGRGKAKSAASTTTTTTCGMKRKKMCGNGGILSIVGGMGGAEEMTSPLQMVHWFRVVLDEAHSIKETSTVASRASCDLFADRRLCLTGTPVQNKLDDVFALIKFLRVEPLDDKNIWTEFIGSPVKFGQTLGIARLQTVMKCITLRRTKESRTEDGTKILTLPPRRDELRYLRFDEKEQEIYDGFFKESRAEFNELSDKNEVMKNYVGILQKILRLRQICDHPDLVHGKDGPGGGKTVEEVIKWIEREGINIVNAGMMFSFLRESGTSQCVECSCELGSPMEGAGGEITASLEENGTAHPNKKARKNTKSATNASSASGTRQNSPTNVYRPILTRCQHLFCVECFRMHVCPGWPNVSLEEQQACGACQTMLYPIKDAIEVNPDATTALDQQQKKVKKKEKRVKGQTSLLGANYNPSTKIKTLLHDLQESSRMNPYSENYCPDDEILMVDANGNQTDDNIIKTVVFSQWTSMLDKIEEGLDLINIRYERLDGTMKREDRSKAMDELKYNKSCEVLLVSLRAGGVGLNLTAAQRVYLMDPYWNPAVENQAVDRIHRLGQKRPVTTIKLIIENSIEARLLEVQKKKTALANMTLAGTTYSKAELMQRRMEELSELFSGGVD